MRPAIMVVEKPNSFQMAKMIWQSLRADLQKSCYMRPDTLKSMDNAIRLCEEYLKTDPNDKGASDLLAELTRERGSTHVVHGDTFRPQSKRKPKGWHDPIVDEGKKEKE